MPDTPGEHAPDPGRGAFGDWRELVDPDADRRSSDREHAQGLGSTRQLDLASMQLELFPSLLGRSLGRGWFESGSLSLAFVGSAERGEALRAFLELAPPGARDVRVEAFVERRDGRRVASGSVAIGIPAASWAHGLAENSETQRLDLRILGPVAVGDRFAPVRVEVGSDALDRWVERSPDAIDWYLDPKPFGACVLPLGLSLQVLRAAERAHLSLRRGRALAVFGAIEIRQLAGPLLACTPYQVAGRVLALGQSPRSEFLWHESRATAADGTCVVLLRLMLRYLKASSPLYTQR